MIAGLKRFAVASLCAATLTCGAAGSAAADPVLFYASAAKEGPLSGPYPPGSGFEGPCGAAVDGNGAFYVADYYHHVVDAFSSGRRYLTQVVDPDPVNGPCGLAVDASGGLYVNEYHQGVVKFSPSAFPVKAGTAYGPGTAIGPVAHATGIAADPATGTLYVNERTYVSVFDSSGQPVQLEGEPLRIGEGSLGDGYGLAFSQHAATAGWLYVADAATNTIKAYDPSVDVVDPVAVIDGSEGPGGQFTSLRDSALAVDRGSGALYVADDLQPSGFERPAAAIDVFAASGSYTGRLPIDVVDPRPPGLAVDNSLGGTRGRVYVTSGNTEGAGVYIYDPKTDGLICTPEGDCPGAAAGTTSQPLSALRSTAVVPSPVSTPAPKPAREGKGNTAIAQQGTLRVSLTGSLSPDRLPRNGQAPVAVAVAGRITTTDQSQPPQLRALRVELNRHGHLDYAGLPTCPYSRIQPASSARALSACRAALVGQGSFEADIALAGQEPYPTQGKLLIFNGISHGKPVLFGQIYAPRPFATSFVIVFAIEQIARGTYGTALTASLPKALGNWGNLTAIEMRLSRRFVYRGERHSYLSASCPAPAGFPGATFPLAQASFRFADGKRMDLGLDKSCRVVRHER